VSGCYAHAYHPIWGGGRYVGASRAVPVAVREVRWFLVLRDAPFVVGLVAFCACPRLLSCFFSCSLRWGRLFADYTYARRGWWFVEVDELSGFAPFGYFTYEAHASGPNMSEFVRRFEGYLASLQVPVQFASEWVVSLLRPFYSLCQFAYFYPGGEVGSLCG
jgi:hypothetical protein